MTESHETRRARRFNLLLVASTGVAFGCAFPPIPLGVLASVALVPLLVLIERLDRPGRVFRYSYLTFFIGSAIALYWVGGFTEGKDPFLMMAGGLLLLAEPFFYSIVALAYFAVRRAFGLRAGLIALPFIWITWEWLYALTELSFPWLTLGNTQTYQLPKIQFAEITGVYGISFWLVVVNVLVFVFLLARLGPSRKVEVRRTILLGVLAVAVFLLPDLYAALRAPMSRNDFGSRPLRVGIVQPNIDPWEKWEGSASIDHYWQQVGGFLAASRALTKDSVSLIVWPETAILFDLPRFGEQMAMFRAAVDSLDAGIVSGFVDYRYYVNGDAPPSAGIIRGSGVKYDAYNSILMVEPMKARVQIYHKMRLVPFAERIPYAEDVPWLIGPLRWNVGVSNWGLGKDSTVFKDDADSTRFLAMICYESVFPEFVSSFVRRGAEFLVFITNDSWWGNTSGARQHSQYAILRAVENRRWVVRCANGGISSFIDPEGRMYDRTSMYTEATIFHSIVPEKRLTFYSKNGDLFARVAAIITGLVFIATAFHEFFFKERIEAT